MRQLLFYILSFVALAASAQNIYREDPKGLYVQLNEHFIIGYDNEYLVPKDKPLCMEIMNHGLIKGGQGREIEIVFEFTYEDGTPVAKKDDTSMSRFSLGKHAVDNDEDYQLIRHRLKIPLATFYGLADREIFAQAFLYLDGKPVARGKRYEGGISKHVRENPRK